MGLLEGTIKEGSEGATVALTAFARPQVAKHAILAGYETHFAKPSDMAELAIVLAAPVGKT